MNLMHTILCILLVMEFPMRPFHQTVTSFFKIPTRTQPAHLAVKTILNNKSEKAQVAYLSAYSTAENKSKLEDESIHIAIVFQLAGFSHVLATLWESNDKICCLAAQEFYRLFFNGEGDKRGHLRVAWAWHCAVKKVRDREPRGFCTGRRSFTLELERSVSTHLLLLLSFWFPFHFFHDEMRLFRIFFFNFNNVRKRVAYRRVCVFFCFAWLYRYGLHQAVNNLMSSNHILEKR